MFPPKNFRIGKNALHQRAPLGGHLRDGFDYHMRCFDSLHRNTNYCSQSGTASYCPGGQRRRWTAADHEQSLIVLFRLLERRMLPNTVSLRRQPGRMMPHHRRLERRRMMHRISPRSPCWRRWLQRNVCRHRPVQHKRNDAWNGSPHIGRLQHLAKQLRGRQRPRTSMRILIFSYYNPLCSGAWINPSKPLDSLKNGTCEMKSARDSAQFNHR